MTPQKFHYAPSRQPRSLSNVVVLSLWIALAVAIALAAYWKWGKSNASESAATQAATDAKQAGADASIGMNGKAGNAAGAEGSGKADANQLAEAKALYQRGLEHEAKRELEQARAAFSAAAKLGHAEALFRSGFYAEGGIGGEVDVSAARSFYEKAGEAGYVDAYAAAALMYITGEATPPDRKVAAEYIEKGLRAGSVEALFLKGVTTLDSDLSGAVDCIRRAAEKGSANAQQLMARLYRDGIGVPKDEQKALEWARLAAASGLSGAQVDLARLLLTSKLFASPAVTQDVAKEATDNLLAAEAQQNARASAELLRAAMKKRPQSKEDVLNVRQLAVQAYEQGNKQTAFGVAMTYMFTREDQAGIEWLAKGAEANDWRCKYAYGLVQSGSSLKNAIAVAAKAKYEDFSAYKAAQSTDQNSRQPVLVSSTSPVFPAGLDIVGAKGSVMAEFVVDPSGVPTNIKILDATHPEMAKAVTDAVVQWRFTPGVKNGKAVSARMQVPVYFRGMK
ncbi:MAG: TonB family protein [Nibricoccus sp.]